METKMITIPFDLERAKRIQEGKEEGKITTRDGSSVRIVCWDVKDPTYCLIALITLLPANCEICKYYNKYGYYNAEDGEGYELDNHALVLRIPKYTQYKDGDILVSNLGNPFIFKSINGKYCDYYVGTDVGNKLIFRKTGEWCRLSEVEGYANKEQKLRFINELKNSKEPIAKEYLEKFFGIKNKTIQPFDKVLVKYDKNDVWNAAFFSHFDKEKPYSYITIGGRYYSECIPYNEETKHLAGTKENWE